MKKQSGQFPYENYWMYKVFHRVEGRYYAILIAKDDWKKRTSRSYAKYLYETTHKINLGKGLTIDHINDDRTDDRIENLQILSGGDNVRKSLSKPPITLICNFCKKEFKRKRNIHNRERSYCTKSCLHQQLRKTHCTSEQ